MQSHKIAALCIGSATVDGIFHDQVTARVCVEYFTIGHPPVFNTESPAFLALGWGIIATWWVGAILAVPAMLSARVGSWPKLTAAGLVLPIAMLRMSMAVASLVAGVVGHVTARAGHVWLVEPLASRVPHEKQVTFLADLWAHSAAYCVGILGGLTVCIRVVARRGRLVRNQPPMPAEVSRGIYPAR